MSTSPRNPAREARSAIIIHVAVLPAVAGLLLSLSVPPSPSITLGLVCLVPLLWKSGQLGYLANALRGAIFTLAFYFAGVSWILDIEGFELWHMLLIAGYLSIGNVVFMVGVRAFAGHSTVTRSLLAAMLWITLEYLRNNAGFLALPWTGLGQAAVESPSLLQLAAATGEYGISFILVFTNSMFAAAISRPSAQGGWHIRFSLMSVGAGVPLLIAIAGVIRLQLHDPSASMSVVAAHLDRSASLVESHTNGQAFLGLEELTSPLLDARQYDLIVWPEGSFKVINAYPFIYGSIHGFSKRVDSAIAFGISSGSKYMRRDQAGVAASMINQFALIDWRNERIQTFSKKVLVPFGEYVPLDGVLSWPGWLVPEMAQFRVDADSRLPTTRNNVSLVPVICWENLFADAIRSRTPQGPAVGVNISDLSVFKSRRAVMQHNAATVMRAVENGIPFVAATNTGPSFLVSPIGEVVSRSNYGQAGWVSGDLSIPSERTLYWHFGDVAVLISALVLALWPLRMVIPVSGREQ